VASPAYLALHPHPSTPDDLHAHNCVRLRWDWDGSLQPWVFENAGRRLEVPVDGSLILNDMYLVMNAVLDGVGVGYLSEPLIQSHVANGLMVPLLGDWRWHMSGVFLYYPSRRQMPGPLRAFIDFMRAETDVVPGIPFKRA
jgi:DNA-binding transcriptional LysR family regulator